MEDNVYFSIDLKSFFAACECADLGLDPYKTPIIVANPHQGNGAITLAITPYLKNIGVKSRCRLYEIPKNIKYTIREPRMHLYKEYSTKVIDIYKEFVSDDDIHIYSIDEVFINIKPYLQLYNKSANDIAKDILNKILEKTGLYASCGIGPNVFLAKVSMDNCAKNMKDGIYEVKMSNYKELLNSIYPLNNIWGIGNSTMKKLNLLGIYNCLELSNYDSNKLKQHLGVVAIDLINYVNGKDDRTIAYFNMEPKGKSYSHSQHLLFDHDENNIKDIFYKMSIHLENIIKSENKLFNTIYFKIIYSKELNIFYSKSVKLETATNSSKVIFDTICYLFDNNYNYMAIRQVDISLMGIHNNNGVQLSLFDKRKKYKENDDVNDIINKLNNKYNKTVISKAKLKVK